MPTIKESDLYAPVKAFLEAQGFAVKGEVNGCDLAAVRGNDLVLVELKVAFNLALVLQGIERQRAADLVYVAVEAPKSARAVPRWNECMTLCRRLNLGLLTVSFAAHRAPRVEVICEPGPYQPKRDLKGRARLVREFTLRSGDFNTGGVNRRPVVTVYRESALLVADHLRQYGPSQPKAVKAATGVAKASTILQDDVYGWFERVTKGVYQVTPKGLEALQTYADVVALKHEAD
jgi:hypothetical protein